MLNRKYVDYLYKRKRIGKIIDLIKNGIYDWSIDDYNYVLHDKKLVDNYHILHYVDNNPLYDYIKRELLKYNDNMFFGNVAIGVYIRERNINIDTNIVKHVLPYNKKIINGHKFKNFKAGYLLASCKYNNYNMFKCILLDKGPIYLLSSGIDMAREGNYTKIIDYIMLPCNINKYYYEY